MRVLKEFCFVFCLVLCIVNVFLDDHFQLKLEETHVNRYSSFYRTISRQIVFFVFFNFSMPMGIFSLSYQGYVIQLGDCHPIIVKLSHQSDHPITRISPGNIPVCFYDSKKVCSFHQWGLLVKDGYVCIVGIAI